MIERQTDRKLTALSSLLGLTFVAAFFCCWQGTALGEARNIRFVVPFAAGGGADSVARLVANGLAARSGRTVIVENRPGANTLLAAELVANSEPDGDTLLFAFDDTFTIFPHLPQTRAFNPAKELVPVNLLGRYLLAVFMNGAVPINSLNELIDQARARPKAFSYGSAGPSSVTYLAMEIFKSLAKIEILHVPYRGVLPALNAIAAGDVQLGVSSYGTARGLIDGRRIKAIAVAGPDRIPQLPNIPTTKELGYAKVDATSWLGIAVPARTPPETIERINKNFSDVLQDGTVRKQLQSRDFDVLDIGPKRFAEQIQERSLLMKEAIDLTNATSQ